MNLTTVHLHGILGEEFGDRHEFVLTTPRDIVHAIESNHPTFKKRILELEREGFGYRLISGNNFDGSDDLDPEQIGLLNQSRDLHLVPVIQGSGAVGKIVGGAVLIGAGFLLGGPAGGLLAKGLIGVGASLALGGVNKLLAPKPPIIPTTQSQIPYSQESLNQSPNTIFGGGGGVSPFDSAIPLVYGRFRIDSPAILSSASQAFRTDTNGVLQNITYFGLLAAVSEGEVLGLATGDGKSVFIGDTALINSDGSANFGRTVLGNTTGTGGQTPPPVLGNFLLTETSVGVALDHAVEITRTLAGGTYYQAWIKIQISLLYNTDNTEGRIDTNTANLQIFAKTDGGGYILVGDINYNARTTTAFEETHAVGLPASVSRSWDIKVVKFGVETDKIKSSFTWSTLTGVAPRTNNYPDTALVGLEVDADFLSSSPQLKLDIFGIKVSVPHNYDPVTRAYSGAFNGTLSGTKQYTNNPVWILYDVLRNSRYGVGLSESEIDIYTFYSASVYCDQFVSNGAGGIEPRFTFNAAIAQRGEAQELMRAIAGSFNAYPVWSNGKISLAQDRPVSPVWAFTQANVVVEVSGDGLESPPFEYSQTDFGSRFTAAQIAYIDPAENWKQEIEPIRDESLIATYGYKSKETGAFGCTSRGQAARIGRWEIFTSSYNDEVVTFRAARDMLPIEIGDVIEIFDRYEQGQKFAGRIAAVNSPTEFILDQSPTLSGADTLSILYPDGTQETRTVTGAIAETITINSAFAQTPAAGYLYALRRTDISPTLWRVLSISEEDEEIYQVQAAKYSEAKWTYVESGALLPEKRTSFLRATPFPPTSLKINYFPEANSTKTAILVRGLLEWKEPTSGVEAVRYDVEYRLSTTQNWTQAVAFGGSFETRLEQGTYFFRVRSVSALNQVSPWAVLQSVLDLDSGTPADVTNFSIQPQAKEFVLATWDASPDIDVRLAGRIRLKFSASDIGWENALLLDEFSGVSRSGNLPLREGTYYAKWVDPYGNESLNAASITTLNIGLLDLNIVATIEEDPSFAGTKTNCYVSPVTGFLTIEPVLEFDDGEGLWDDNPVLWDDYTGGAYKSNAIYEFANELVVTDVQDVSLVADYAAVSNSTLTLIDNAPNLWDERAGLFDGELTGNASIQLQVRTSLDGVTYGDWMNFTVGVFRLLTAQFRAVLKAVGGENISVSDLNVIADVADRTEVGTVVTSAIADTVVSFARPFITAPTNGVAYSVQSGTLEDEVDIFAVTKDGFKINIKNGGARISRTVRWVTESY